MVVHLAALLMVAAVARPGPLPAEDPRAVVRIALSAVEGDSAERVRARWEVRLRSNPADRAALLGLATIASLTYHYDEADRRYAQLAPTDSARPDRYAIYAWIGHGASLGTRGVFTSADSLYDRAINSARAVGDTAAAAAALIGAAAARSRDQSAVAGSAALDSARALIPAADTALELLYETRRAALLVQLSRSEAREQALQCAALAARVGDFRDEGSCLQSVAVDAQRRGATDSAIAILEQVAVLQRKARNYSALAAAMQWRGYLLSTLGYYGESRTVLHAAIESGEASANRGALAWAVLDLAEISRLLQDRPSAASYLARSVASFRAQGDRWGEMAARDLEVNLAIDARDFARARAINQVRLGWARDAHQPLLAYGAYTAAAEIAEREDDWDAATRDVDSARAVARRNEMIGLVDELSYRDGRIALRRGDLAGAEHDFTAYLARLGPAQRLYRYRTRARLASIYAKRGELDRAARELLAAGGELDTWRATVTDRELRVAAFQIDDDEDSDLGVPGTLAALVAGGRVTDAFALAEQRRARELADDMVRARAMRATAHDAARVVAPSLTAQRVTAQDVIAALPDDSTTLLEYVTGEMGQPTTLFAVTRTGVRGWVLAPADSLSKAIGRFRAFIESGAAPAALGRALAGAVLDSAVAALGPRIERLVVVRDGPLYQLPFDALRMRNGRFAVERFAIGATPSAAVATELWRRERVAVAGRGGRPVRVLAFGDPVFATGASSEDAGEGGAGASGGGDGEPISDAGAASSAAASSADDPGAAYRVAFAAAGGLPRLGDSGREARLAASYAPGSVVRLRGAASESYLERAPLDSFRVLHFATHALVDERSVAGTALALSPGGGKSGFVTPGDLAALHLDADLVVLSACQSAGGVLVDGEGVQGLTAPLLQAGARSVVATAWRIDDRATVSLIHDFYSGLARGLGVGDALRNAKLDALRGGAPPAQWAAFDVIGDPIVRVPLRDPPQARWWWAVLVACLAGAAIAISVAQWRRQSHERVS